MAPFTLPASFRIHYDGIDEEHERLVKVINGLTQDLVDGEAKDFEPTFAAFLKAMETHFKNEEAHMASLGYTGLDWHRSHHRDCLDRARALRECCRDRGYADIQIMRQCFDEVITDVARADLKFGEFLDDKRLRE